MSAGSTTSSGVQALAISTEYRTTCPECGALLVNGSMGAICIAGPTLHGKIHPKLTSKDAAKAARFWKYQQSVPSYVIVKAVVASTSSPSDERMVNSSIYVIDGMPGLYRRVKRTGDGTKHEDGTVIARSQETHAVHEFVRWEAGESEILAAFGLEGAERKEVDTP